MSCIMCHNLALDKVLLTTWMTTCSQHKAEDAWHSAQASAVCKLTPLHMLLLKACSYPIQTKLANDHSVSLDLYEPFAGRLLSAVKHQAEDVKLAYVKDAEDYHCAEHRH